MTPEDRAAIREQVSRWPELTHQQRDKISLLAAAAAREPRGEDAA